MRNFSSLDARKRRVLLKPANDVISSFLAKVVGDEKVDQMGYFMWHIKRI